MKRIIGIILGVSAIIGVTAYLIAKDGLKTVLLAYGCTAGIVAFVFIVVELIWG